MSNHTKVLSIGYYAPYVLPFALFASITILAPLFHINHVFAYTLKTILCAFSLLFYWNVYKHEIKIEFSWLAIISGLAVFIIWVLPEGYYPQIGHSEFNPYNQSGSFPLSLTITIRVIGASIVVPVMEELFWRSFALRYAIRTDFKSLPLGQFSWFSFIFVSLVFGFEHHRWLVGIIAGLVYAGILYRSRNLFIPISSHAITNFVLAIYVLWTQNWSFW